MTEMKIVHGRLAPLGFSLLHQQKLPVDDAHVYQRCPLRIGEEILLDGPDGDTTEGFTVDRIIHDKDGTIYVIVHRSSFPPTTAELLRGT